MFQGLSIRSSSFLGCSFARSGKGTRRLIDISDHDCLPKLLVPDKERESGQVHVLMPLLNRLHKRFRRDDDIGRGVDDGDLNRGVGLREVERRRRLGGDLVGGHGCWVDAVCVK